MKAPRIVPILVGRHRVACITVFVNVLTQNGYDAVLHDLRLVQYLGALVEAPNGINEEISHRAALRATKIFSASAGARK